MCLCSPHSLQDARSLEERERKTVSPVAKLNQDTMADNGVTQNPSTLESEVIVWLLRDNKWAGPGHLCCSLMPRGLCRPQGHDAKCNKSGTDSWQRAGLALTMPWV